MVFDKSNTERVRKPLLMAISAALVTVFSPQTAFAQEVVLTAIEEVVVTARKRTESLQDTPISITAFSSEALEAKNILSIDQIGESAPNVIFDKTTPFGPANSSSIIIRGIGLKDFTLVSEPGVGLYVDDIYIPHSLGNVSDVVDIERIEVLRGPQGTLFGRNTIGGAVRVVTKKPNDELAGRVGLSVGSRDRRDIKGSVNLPISDEFFVRMSGLVQEWDGYIDTPNLSDDKEPGSKDTKTFVGAARWVPNEDFTADLTIGYSDDESGRQPSILVAAPAAGAPLGGYGVNAAAAAAAAPNAPALFDTFGPHYEAAPESDLDFSNFDPGTSLELFNVGLTLDWNLTDNIGLKSISSYRDVEGRFFYDLDHSPLIVVHGQDFVVSDSWSQELQLYGDAFDGKLNWTVGAYHFEEAGVFDEYVPFGTFFEIFSGGEIESESSAVFGQFTYEFSDRFDITFGLRYSDESKDWIVDADHQFFIASRPNLASFSGILPDPSIPRIQIVPIGTQNTSADSTDPYLNISYDWSDALMTYATYSEGFKGGGFQERNGPGSLPDRSYNPEFAKVFELGAKWSSADRRYTVNGAVFHTDYTDLQLNVIDGIARAIRNAGEADISGFEVELIALPTDALTFSAGVGYLDAEYGSIPQVAIDGGIAIDNELPGVPEWQANASLAYEISSSFGSFTPRLDISYSDEQFNDSANNELYKRDAYTLVNASIAFVSDSSNWSVTLYGKNLADERYFVAGFEDANRVYTDAAISPPREWGLSVGYHF